LQELFQPTSLIAAANTPHGGRVAFHSVSHFLNRFPCSNRENDARVLHLIPGQPAAARDRLDRYPIGRYEHYLTGFSATHEAVSNSARAVSILGPPGDPFFAPMVKRRAMAKTPRTPLGKAGSWVS
jgi:hypothetical protein